MVCYRETCLAGSFNVSSNTHSEINYVSTKRSFGEEKKINVKATQSHWLLKTYLDLTNSTARKEKRDKPSLIGHTALKQRPVLFVNRVLQYLSCYVMTG